MALMLILFDCFPVIFLKVLLFPVDDGKDGRMLIVAIVSDKISINHFELFHKLILLVVATPRYSSIHTEIVPEYRAAALNLTTSTAFSSIFLDCFLPLVRLFRWLNHSVQHNSSGFFFAHILIRFVSVSFRWWFNSHFHWIDFFFLSFAFFLLLVLIVYSINFIQPNEWNSFAGARYRTAPNHDRRRLYVYIFELKSVF